MKLLTLHGNFMNTQHDESFMTVGMSFHRSAPSVGALQRQPPCRDLVRTLSGGHMLQGVPSTPWAGLALVSTLFLAVSPEGYIRGREVCRKIEPGRFPS